MRNSYIYDKKAVFQAFNEDKHEWHLSLFENIFIQLRASTEAEIKTFKKTTLPAVFPVYSGSVW